MTPRTFALLMLVPLLVPYRAAAEFVHPAKAGDPLIYGVKNGIMIAVHPFSLDSRRDARPQGGPRGLIRVGYQEGGKLYLLNFIAVEPLVGSAPGLSELENGSDGKHGKRFWVGDSLKNGGVGKNGNVAGRIEETPAGRVLSFVLHVEPYANGARPVIEVSLLERFPHRVRFRTFSAPGGANMQRCVLSATMGNQPRCRWLWLGSGPVFAPTLYAGYTGTDFVEKQTYGLPALRHTQDGDVVAAISPEEFEPREVWPLPTNAWHYDCKWLAQFWLKPKGSHDESLHCRVNGRRVYWAGTVPIPGGICYENFEFRERFRPGRELWYGYTSESPAKMFGFGYDVAPRAVAPRKVLKAEETAAAEAARTAQPLTNGDFTAGFDGWRAEGGAMAFQTFKQGTQTALTTYGKNKEADTGRLYQCFKVPADASVLRFSLHGGADSQRTYVALWHGPRLHRRMTGRNDKIPFRVAWDLVPLRGEVVTLEIVDKSVGPWGFIGAQGFRVVSEE